MTAANLAIETVLPADAESALRLRGLAELPEPPRRRPELSASKLPQTHQQPGIAAAFM